MRIALVMSMVLVGACGYRAGSFSFKGSSFAGPKRTVGCLDVAVAPYRDGATAGPALQVTVGNRCDAAVPVDLATLPVTVRYADGREFAVHPFDPHDELEVVWLEARWTGIELLEYMLPADPPGRAVELCVDLAGLDAESPDAHEVLVCVPASPPVMDHGDHGLMVAEVLR